MNLTPAKSWLRRHKKWRAKRTAVMAKTTVADLNNLNEQYVKLIQANALKWAMHKSTLEIKHRVQGLEL